jgi:hypothetical protein
MKRVREKCWVLVVLMVILAMPACGASASNGESPEATQLKTERDATVNFLKDFKELRLNDPKGQKADILSKDIATAMNQTKLKEADVFGPDEIQGYVKMAHGRSAGELVGKLGILKANPDQAKKLKDEIMAEVDKSGRTFAELGLSYSAIADIVVRNETEAKASREMANIAKPVTAEVQAPASGGQVAGSGVPTPATKLAVAKASAKPSAKKKLVVKKSVMKKKASAKKTGTKKPAVKAQPKKAPTKPQ